MPFDLWFKSTETPVAFQPERVPIPPLENREMALEVQGAFAHFAGSSRSFDLEIVHVDDDGQIVDDLPMSADGAS